MMWRGREVQAVTSLSSDSRDPFDRGLPTWRPQEWDDDELLMRDLSVALRGLPPAPPEFVVAAEGALAWRTIDVELAELSYDSAADRQLLTRTRSTSAARTLAFHNAGVTIEVELTETGIVGQLVPGSGARVTVETMAGVFAETVVDEIGCFLFAPPPAVPFRLYARSDRYAVVTPWMGSPVAGGRQG
jgi:hypothetical protein